MVDKNGANKNTIQQVPVKEMCTLFTHEKVSISIYTSFIYILNTNGVELSVLSHNKSNDGMTSRETFPVS